MGFSFDSVFLFLSSRLVSCYTLAGYFFSFLSFLDLFLALFLSLFALICWSFSLREIPSFSDGRFVRVRVRKNCIFLADNLWFLTLDCFRVMLVPCMTINWCTPLAALRPGASRRGKSHHLLQ